LIDGAVLIGQTRDKTGKAM